MELSGITAVDNRPALITELMEVNLSTYITRKGGSVSLNLQVLLSLDMSQGLEALHRHSLLHGNLHDHNILIQGDQAKISDYCYPLLGLEYHHCEDHKSYMAPEVVHSKSSFSSDIFSLGALIFKVVTGCSPTEDSKKMFTGIPQDHILLSLIQQCLSESADRRPSIIKICEDVRNAQNPQVSFHILKDATDKLCLCLIHKRKHLQVLMNLQMH